MDLNELMALAAWIDRHLGAKRVHKLYNALLGPLNENAQGVQPRKPFEQELSNLLSALEAADESELTQDQTEFLDKLGLAELVGVRGATNLRTVLNETPLDVASTARKVSELSGKFGQGMEKVGLIKNALSSLVEKPEVEEPTAILRIRFAGKAALGNIVDFKTWGQEWHDIGRGIALAVGIKPEEIRVIGARKGSIILELGLALAVVKLISAISMECLKVAGRTLEIMEQYQKVQALKLANEQLAQDIKKEAENEKKAGLERIQVEIEALVSSEHQLDGEQKTALSASVRKLVSFLEKGGELDVHIPEAITSEGNAQEAEKLRETVREIRRLEAQQKRLEHLE
jgi:hypothetical protein